MTLSLPNTELRALSRNHSSPEVHKKNRSPFQPIETTLSVEVVDSKGIQRRRRAHGDAQPRRQQGS